eukprot:15340768-Ditylum_brightwellii.AAC.1
MQTKSIDKVMKEGQYGEVKLRWNGVPNVIHRSHCNIVVEAHASINNMEWVTDKNKETQKRQKKNKPIPCWHHINVPV